MAQRYIFIAITFNLSIAILCAKMSRVNEAQGGRNFKHHGTMILRPQTYLKNETVM